MVHEGSKLYKCDLCDAKFAEISSLCKQKTTAHERKNCKSKESISENFEFKYASGWSVKKIIKCLKNTSSIGIDMIPTRAWKLGVEILAGPVEN